MLNVKFSASFILSNYCPYCSSLLQLVLLICQIKVNSMAIIHIKSTDEAEKFKKGQNFSAVNNVLSSIEQVSLKISRSLLLF